MTTLFSPLLAAALMAQFQRGTLQGTVADDQGKPVAAAQVVVYAPAPLGGSAEPVDVRGNTDVQGRFRLTPPPLASLYLLRARVWAYRSGSAITATLVKQTSAALLLRKPEPKTVKIEGSDGQPIAAARVSPRVVSVAKEGSGDVPAVLAASLAVTTGPDGKAMLTYLGTGDKLLAVRVEAASIGAQDFVLLDRPGRDDQSATITIRLTKTSRLAGRVKTREGQPVADQAVEVWSQGSSWLEPSPVGFKNGPLHTAADGSFQTSDSLLVGSPYRVVVRAPGKEPILSDWITIGEQPRVLLPLIQRPLRAIRGQVVDRLGKPVAGVEVFQSGDGPERTATKTDADGRFTLAGFRQGTVFLFARGKEFRFFGRMIKPGDGDVTVELTRTSERPTHEMRMLPDAIPPEEARALARRLLEPYWNVFEFKNENDKIRILQSLAPVDPVGVLRKLEEVQFAGGGMKSVIQVAAARALSRTDPTQAESVAAAIDVPDIRAVALVAVADALPDAQHDRKVALVDRAGLAAKAATRRPQFRLQAMGEVAERWLELGEREKAKAFFADGLRLASQIPAKAGYWRGKFAARLARVDLPSALAIAKEFPGSPPYSESWVLWNIALRLASENPAEAERVLRRIPQETVRDWFPPALAWKMAAVDPARALRLVEESQRYLDHPESYLLLANGLKSRDPAAAQQAFQAALDGIDRWMKDGAMIPRFRRVQAVLLPLVEQIDPALVPELFWRAVAMRPTIGNPRSAREYSNSVLVMLLAWYDRDVAASLFDLIRGQMEHIDDLELAGWWREFLGWSIFDPRAAVARLEKVPVPPQLDLHPFWARQDVSEMLCLSHEERWRRIWSDYNTEMRDLFERDLR